MARRYEGSAKDLAEDRRGAKRHGMSLAEYERSPMDKAEDRRGQKELTVKKHTPNFHPGGKKGKLHRELGIPTSEKIPAGRLASATHSSNPEIRRDAIRAKTMKGWHHHFAHHPPRSA